MSQPPPEQKQEPREAENIEPSNLPKKVTYFRELFDQGVVTQDIFDYKYRGSGTQDDPYVVTWIPETDPRNPMLYSPLKKWTLTLIVGMATLAVSLVSSGYTGGVQEMMLDFHASEEVMTLGVSLFVLGFAYVPHIFPFYIYIQLTISQYRPTYVAHIFLYTYIYIYIQLTILQSCGHL